MKRTTTANESEEFSRPALPEYRLLNALLVRAILDLVSMNQNDSRSARRWFKSNSRHFTSYTRVCETIGIDAPRLLNKLIELGCFELDREDRPIYLTTQLGSFISS